MDDIIPTNLSSSLDALVTINEAGAKELIIKYLMSDNISQIRSEESQKTILIDGSEADKFIEYLQHHELHLRYCRLCDLILADHQSNEHHVM